MSEAEPLPKERTWHWRSTPETAEKAELSVLAVVETIFAVGVYVFIACKGYYLHFVIGAILTPFFMLRTHKSEEFIFQYVVRVLEFGVVIQQWILPTNRFKVDEVSKVRRLFLLVGQLVRLLLIASLVFYILFEIDRSIIGENSDWVRLIAYFVVIYAGLFLSAAAPFILPLYCLKFVSTVRSLTKYPITSIKSVPNNYYRAFACIDFFFPIELVYGSRRMKDKRSDLESVAPLLCPADLVREFLDYNSGASKLRFISLLMGSIFSSPFYLFGLFYRISIKGLLIIYLPLLWIIHGAFSCTVLNRFKEECHLAFYNFRRMVSMLVIGFVASKVFFHNFWIGVADKYNSEVVSFVSVFLAPDSLPLWQIASGINGVIAFIIFFIADYVVKNEEKIGVDVLKKPIENLVRVLWFVSGVLTIYTLSINIYNAFTLQFNLIPIDTKLFPWA